MPVLDIIPFMSDYFYLQIFSIVDELFIYIMGFDATRHNLRYFQSIRCGADQARRSGDSSLETLRWQCLVIRCFIDDRVSSDFRICKYSLRTFTDYILFINLCRNSI